MSSSTSSSSGPLIWAHVEGTVESVPVEAAAVLRGQHAPDAILVRICLGT